MASTSPLRLLLARSWRQATRDKATNFARAGTNISSALIFGSIYFRMRRTQSTIQDRLGLLQVRRGEHPARSCSRALLVRSATHG
jgi:hypothetical protein